MDSFLAPTLSLPTQLEMELDKRTAARMSRDQLVTKTQELIESWYLQSAMLNGALGEIRQLQVKLALAGAGKAWAGREARAMGAGVDGAAVSTYQ